MGKIKFSIHPLFILFGIYFAIIGKVFSFLVFTLVAVIHELGHSVMAESLGYRLKQVTLMPYGAVISSETTIFSYKDEVKISLAGPLVNLLVVVVFVALWWVEPDFYPLTELAVTASLTIATINLFPCYPLDGGRLVLATLSQYFNRKKCVVFVKVLSFVFAGVLFGLFVVSLVLKTPNISILFFSFFIVFGNVFVSNENKYVKAFSFFSLSKLKRGKVVKKIAVTDKTLVRELFKFITPNELFEVEIYNEKTHKKTVLSCDKTVKILNEGNYSSSISAESKRLLR